VVNDAMMKPVRMLQETCYFKVIKQGEIPKKEETTTSQGEEEENGNANKNDDAFEEYYMPCLETDKGAMKKNFNEIPKDQIVLRKLHLVRLYYEFQPNISPID